MLGKLGEYENSIFAPEFVQMIYSDNLYSNHNEKAITKKLYHRKIKPFISKHKLKIVDLFNLYKAFAVNPILFSDPWGLQENFLLDKFGKMQKEYTFLDLCSQGVSENCECDDYEEKKIFTGWNPFWRPCTKKEYNYWKFRCEMRCEHNIVKYSCNGVLSVGTKIAFITCEEECELIVTELRGWATICHYRCPTKNKKIPHYYPNATCIDPAIIRCGNVYK